MDDCANLEKCGFVKKYGEEKAIAVKGFIRMYCQGDMQNDCVKKNTSRSMARRPPTI